MDLSDESILLVGAVFDGTKMTVGFNQPIFALNVVAVTVFLLAVVVAVFFVLNFVVKFVSGMVVVGFLLVVANQFDLLVNDHGDMVRVVVVPS